MPLPVVTTQLGPMEAQPVAIVDASGNVVTPGGGTSAPVLPAGTNRSGTITTANASQQLAPANALRQSLTGQAPSNAQIGINEMGADAVIGQPGTYLVAAGQAFSIATNQKVSIVCGTANAVWSATETP